MPTDKFFSFRTKPKVEESSSEEYRKFFELSSDLFVIVDSRGLIQTVNPVWETVLGYRTEEFIGRPIMAFIHPDDLEKTVDALAYASRHLSFKGFENRYRSKNGHYRTIRWSTTSKGPAIYAVGRDVTEDEDIKQKLEEANRRMHSALQLEREARSMTETQHERFRDFFAQAPMIAVVFAGANQVIELANPSFYTLVNYRNLMGRPVREAIHLDPQTSTILTKVYDTGERFVGRNFSIRADWAETGKNLEKRFHCIFEPIRGRDAKVDVIWCLLFDVTETVEMEAKLRSAERMASLGEMAAGVAHEINNPLGYTLISLEMLQGQLANHFGENKIPHETVEILSRATEGVERVQNIVRGLKSFTRNDESRLEPVDLVGPLRAAVNFTSNET
ncbi:MAG: PAS domain S-box protein, partial [Proteobacteria bacterium]